MNIYLLMWIVGVPILLLVAIAVTSKIVWKRISRRYDEEVKRLSVKFENEKKNDERLISALKDTVEAQDEQINELKKILF